jgi:hypothetical protein
LYFCKCISRNSVELIFAISSLYKNIEKIRLNIEGRVPLLLDPIPLGFKPEVLEHIARLDLKNHALNVLIELQGLDHRFKFIARTHEPIAGKIMENDVHKDRAKQTLESLAHDCELVLEDAKLVEAETKFFIQNDKPKFSSYQPFYDKAKFSRLLPKILKEQENQFKEDKLKDLRAAASKKLTAPKS